jgi:hypothetical protein
MNRKTAFAVYLVLALLLTWFWYSKMVDDTHLLAFAVAALLANSVAQAIVDVMLAVLPRRRNTPTMSKRS